MRALFSGQYERGCEGALLEKVAPRAPLQNLAHPAVWLSKTERHTAGGSHLAFLLPLIEGKARRRVLAYVSGNGPCQSGLVSPRLAIEPRIHGRLAVFHWRKAHPEFADLFLPADEIFGEILVVEEIHLPNDSSLSLADFGLHKPRISPNCLGLPCACRAAHAERADASYVGGRFSLLGDRYGRASFISLSRQA